MSEWNQNQRNWYPTDNTWGTNSSANTWGTDPSTDAWRNDSSAGTWGNNSSANSWGNGSTEPYNAAPTYYTNQQYVGFNEFLSQMQQNGQHLRTGYSNNHQYHGLNGVSHDNLQPSNQCIAPQMYQIPQHNSNQPTSDHYNGGVEANFVSGNNINFTSNLTPTATEFVPKNSFLQSNAQYSDAWQPEASASKSHVDTSTSSNWRNNSSTSNKKSVVYTNSDVADDVKVNGASSSRSEGVEDHKDKLHNSKTKQKAAPKITTTEDVGRTFYNRNSNKPSSSQDVRSKNRDSRFDNNSKDNSENYRDNRDSKKDCYNLGTYREKREYSGRDNQNREANHSRDDYSRDIQDNNREYFGRDNSYKSRNDRDGNSSYSRESEASNRDYKEGNQRNRYGTPRVQRYDRNCDEEEQYANSYLQYRDERQDNRRPVVSEKLQLVPASPTKQKSAYKRTNKEENCELTQRERLSDQLDRGVLECLVCCERVRQVDAVWSCNNCYHVLHLRCVRKWADSSRVEGKWRCPACQNTSDNVPMEYLCFCGAMRAPEWVRGSSGAHSCGEGCRRPRACVHPCVLPCHPGPCPPCQATLNKKCGCGAETRAVVCSSKLEQTCGRTCGRTLNCGVHVCKLTCHAGDCPTCTETIQQVCHCPAGKTRVVECTSATSGARAWACGDACGRVLACGAHVCRDTCHAPPCRPCHLLPESVFTCPCGKMKLSEADQRTSCSDPIPLCGNICAKPLTCGPPNDLHFCKSECHDGACPPCPDKTLMNCRCGHSSREVDCVELPQMIDNIFCTKKCNKKLSCGRHRCRELCCALDTHRCPQPCGRMLTCGLHRCDELCHTGHCPGCTRLDFTELRCECGAAVLFPPVACGARPPVCSQACVRARACGHPPHHTCHFGECPPCVVLTTKRCHGAHEERKTIPCHQEEFSCGLPCGKPLPCGKHVCIKLCHKGECATSKCVQQCNEKRPSCGHPCGAPCHVSSGDDSVCPSPAPCRLTVRATCPCKRRVAEKTCADNARDFAKTMSTMVASKMQDGSSVDLSDVTRPGRNLITLECDDECRVEARTRQMALVLQIRNPDTSSKLAPRYSDLLRQWAVRDPTFADHVHAKLTNLVQLAKKSKQKTRSHSFPSMNRQKRQFVHELCEHFGCESVAYDAEPNRNVVATADREKSWLPSMSVLEVLEREAGKRRVPGPVLRPATGGATAAPSQAASKAGSGWATLTSSRSSSNPWGARTASAAPPTPAQRSAPTIDYFDNPPTN